MCGYKPLQAHLTSHSVLQVSIIKYILILKYSIFHIMYQKCFCHLSKGIWTEKHGRVLGWSPGSRLHPPWWVGCSPPARAPAQLEGFPLGQREPYSKKTLVSLGPRLQASPLHTGSWVCYCLGCYLFAALRGLGGQGIGNVDYPFLLLQLRVQVSQAVAVLARWLQVTHA